MHNLYLEIRRNESLTFDPLIFGAQEQILRIYESFVVLFTLEVFQSDLCLLFSHFMSFRSTACFIARTAVMDGSLVYVL
jgi:hypothetical protein